MAKFWQFRNQADGSAELLLYGDIADTSWWGMKLPQSSLPRTWTDWEP